MRAEKEIEDTGHIPQSRMDIDYRLLPHAYGEGMLENPETSLKAPVPPIAKARKKSEIRNAELYYEMLERPLTPEELFILQEVEVSRGNVQNVLLPKGTPKNEYEAFDLDEEPSDEELESIEAEKTLREIYGDEDEWETYGEEEEWEPHELLEKEADRKLIEENIKRLSEQDIVESRRIPGDRQPTKKTITKERRRHKAV